MLANLTDNTNFHFRIQTYLRNGCAPLEVWLSILTWVVLSARLTPP